MGGYARSKREFLRCTTKCTTKCTIQCTTDCTVKWCVTCAIAAAAPVNSPSHWSALVPPHLRSRCPKRWMKLKDGQQTPPPPPPHRILSISPIVPSGQRKLIFVKGTDGKVCGLRKNGEDGSGELGNMGVSLHVSPVSRIGPPVFAIFLPLAEVLHTVSLVIL